MTELKFRNINVSPDAPVSLWGVEGITACLERGHLKYWRKLAVALQGDSTGRLHEETRLALQFLEHPNGVATLFAEMLDVMEPQVVQATPC
jgi:hypothetical protein